MLGHPLYDESGSKVGDVKHVFLDDETGRPEWLGIKTGLLGNKETFVPTSGAEWVADHVEAEWEKDFIKQAPHVDVEAGHISADEEEQLYRYYGIGPGGRHAQAHPGDAAPERGRETDDAMTRSEEELHVRKETRESGRARLRKYVVTEEQEMTVPVSHEEVRVEREPITGENRDAAMRGAEITEAEHEVTLHEERPVVSKETTPVERVRASKETVTEEETVGGEVRKERIELEEEEDARRRGHRER
ncbi:PRC and DUF2382 domain-containing protein [Actinomadura sp. GC306]|uniref:DUF2382 domain-containing protein n=1 Tax=Actinomadura sp. GC306 TaxID=2530367 RepID=UPI001FB61AF4|nr:PRC and DUF2382 domain-containing protein [Actinomadura sp. GC306]